MNKRLIVQKVEQDVRTVDSTGAIWVSLTDGHSGFTFAWHDDEPIPAVGQRMLLTLEDE